METILYQLPKPYFTIQNVAAVFSETLPSARVRCVRYCKRRKFIRLKRNTYVLSPSWIKEGERILPYAHYANITQVPSYISLLTALAYYDITSQVPQNIVESIALKRSKHVTIFDVDFNYLKVKKEYYFGYLRQDTFFIAKPEKALIDSIYLMSLGRYALDISALSFEGLDKVEIEKILRRYPDKTINWCEKYGII